MMKKHFPSTVLQIAVAYAGFVVLGLTASLLGVAWPSIRATFDLSLDAVGVLMLATIAGAILSSFNSGSIATVIGVGPFLMINSLVMGVGFLGSGLAPAWWVMVMFGLLSGMGSGAMHAGLNAHFAANHSVGAMNWLHACFGLGATLGPLLMTAILKLGYPWRWGYGLGGVCLALLAVSFAATRDQWRGFARKKAPQNPTAGKINSRETLKQPAVWLSLALFFVYTGVEKTAGQWAYSLFTEARSVTASTAGFWTSVYWAGLMIGRLLLGGMADRLRTTPLVRTSILGVACGAALVWWHATNLFSFLGLALIGVAEASIFPALTSSTFQRVGVEHADNAIGFQVAAAGLGGVTFSALAGVLAENASLEIVGPFLLALSLTMFLLHELVSA